MIRVTRHYDEFVDTDTYTDSVILRHSTLDHVTSFCHVPLCSVLFCSVPALFVRVTKQQDEFADTDSNSDSDHGSGDHPPMRSLGSIRRVKAKNLLEGTSDDDDDDGRGDDGDDKDSGSNRRGGSLVGSAASSHTSIVSTTSSTVSHSGRGVGESRYDQLRRELHTQVCMCVWGGGGLSISSTCVTLQCV